MVSQATKEYLKNMYERDMNNEEKIISRLDTLIDIAREQCDLTQMIMENRNDVNRKHEYSEEELTIDMGYRGELKLIIKFTDQNCITHTRNLIITVHGEKPTMLRIVEEEKILYLTNEREK